MPSTALFIVDIQVELAACSETEVPSANALRSSVTTILERARSVPQADIQLVFVQHEEDEGLIRGTPGWELVFRPEREGELLVSKRTGDTFASNPELAGQLKAEGVETVVVCGIQSDFCVRATSKGALAAAFKVILLSGAHATYPVGGKSAEEVSKEIDEELAGLGAKVVPWDEWRP